MRTSAIGWLSLSALVIALDRLTKALATAFPAEITLIPGVLRWIYAENTGMSFSLLSGHSWVLGVFSVLVVVVCGIFLSRYQLSRCSRLGAVLMASGALSNAYDRLVIGYVVDMLDITLFPFAIFNLADTALTIGAVLVGYCLLLRTDDWRKKPHDTRNT